MLVRMLMGVHMVVCTVCVLVCVFVRFLVAVVAVRNSWWWP